MSELLTVLDVVQKSSAFLERKGVENPRLNAEWLAASALGIDRMALYLQFDRPLVESELEAMRERVTRRGKREPLQYIIGQWQFRDLVLKTDKRALIPRSETEQLVELIIERCEDDEAELRILDLGTGTGAIALSLAMELPRVRVLGVDKSAEAVELATENANLSGMHSRVEFRTSDWFSEIEEERKFDLIVSNPPYLTDVEMQTAQPEVKDFEPRTALFAEESGLSDLKKIIEESFVRLNEGGSLWLETGIDHRKPLLAFCENVGYAKTKGFDDWSGRERFVWARR